MKSLSLLLFLSLSSLAATDLEKRPAPFVTTDGQAVFTDFKNAYYEVTYDVIKQKALVEAYIAFENAETGLPVFDSLSQPEVIELDGKIVSDKLIATPDKRTLIRVVNETVEPGLHQLKVTLPLEQMLEFVPEGVKSAFWMGDLEDRNYIEKYLPTNFIFDRVPMVLRLKFVGGADNQRIYTNGLVEKIAANDFKVTFQENLNVTCPYFHTVPKGSFTEKIFSFKSIDGRNLPGVVYVPNDTPEVETKLTSLVDQTTAIINELEADYGPFPHQSITIYNNAPTGGMEYSGATITSESALGHELFHSYFARGVMPADGNSGWIDEALARWRDYGYRRLGSLTGTSRMANLGPYNRLTDRLAYSFGERFISLLDGKTQDRGGMKPFLRHLVKTRSFDPMSTESLISELNTFFGEDFTKDFKQYVYGEGKKGRPFKSKQNSHDEIHRQFSEADMRKML